MEDCFTEKSSLSGAQYPVGTLGAGLPEIAPEVLQTKLRDIPVLCARYNFRLSFLEQRGIQTVGELLAQTRKSLNDIGRETGFIHKPEYDSFRKLLEDAPVRAELLEREGIEAAWPLNLYRAVFCEENVPDDASEKILGLLAIQSRRNEAVLRLRYEENLTQQETAEWLMMGITEVRRIERQTLSVLSRLGGRSTAAQDEED